MRTKLAILLALLSLSTFLAACGDDDEETTDASASEEVVEEEGEALSKEEFIEEGDTICAGLTIAGESVEAPETEEDLPVYLTELLGQAEAARDDLAALTPPEDGEEVHQALLESLETSMGTVEGAIDAAEDGDTVTVEDLMSQASDEGDAANEAAQEYGFQECGSDEGEDPSRSSGGAAG